MFDKDNHFMKKQKFLFCDCTKKVFDGYEEGYEYLLLERKHMIKNQCKTGSLKLILIGKNRFSLL